MDANRLFRFTVPGWAFLIFWGIHSWNLGFNFRPIIDEMTKIQSIPSAISMLVVGLAAGPVLGFFLSGFAYATIKLFSGAEAGFRAPASQDELDRYVKAMKKFLSIEDHTTLDAIVSETPKAGWFKAYRSRQVRSKLLPYFNLIIHSRASSNLIEYGTRRWTIYWMHLNTITAFVAATIAALLTSGNFLDRPFLIDTRFFAELAIILFTLTGILRVRSIPEEVSQVAWLWLYVEASHVDKDVNKS